MKIYADSLFLLNFIIDYLLLLAAGKICCLPLKRWRMLLGAAWGGVYAVLAAVWPGFFALWTVKLLSGAGAVAAAYGGMGRYWRATGAFFAVGAAFGGAVYAALGLSGGGSGRLFIPVSMKVLALSFAVCYAGVSMIFRHIGKRGERTLVKGRAELGERQLEFTALEDTGNGLCDPVSGEKVTILDRTLAEELLGARLPVENAKAFFALEELGLRPRLLSFSSLGGAGMLVCFRADKLSIDGRQAGSLLAIAPGEVCASGEYRAIF